MLTIAIDIAVAVDIDISRSAKLPRSGGTVSKRRRSEDKKIVKFMKKKLTYDSPDPTICNINLHLYVHIFIHLLVIFK